MAIENVRVEDDRGDASVSALHANGLRPPMTVHGIAGPLVVATATTSGTFAISLPVATAARKSVSAARGEQPANG
jgi:hypothetical protein